MMNVYYISHLGTMFPGQSYGLFLYKFSSPVCFFIYPDIRFKPAIEALFIRASSRPDLKVMFLYLKVIASLKILLTYSYCCNISSLISANSHGGRTFLWPFAVGGWYHIHGQATSKYVSSLTCLDETCCIIISTSLLFWFFSEDGFHPR